MYKSQHEKAMEIFVMSDSRMIHENILSPLMTIFFSPGTYLKTPMTSDMKSVYPLSTMQRSERFMGGGAWCDIAEI